MEVSKLNDGIISLNLYNDMLERLSFEQNCNILELQNESGMGKIYNYKIFPGVEINFNNLFMKNSSVSFYPSNNIVEINHCYHGRYECRFNGDSYVYVASGDLSINAFSSRKIASCFPLGYYRGITITIDFNMIPDELYKLFELLMIDIDNIRNQIRGAGWCHVIRSDATIEHLFSELYNINENRIYGYIKVKFLEILLYLSDKNFNESYEEKEYFPKVQVEKIKEIHDFMIKKLNYHYTLDELSKKFNISLTAMKKCFKGVYGQSIYAYLKKYRLQMAEEMLTEGKYNVSQVAELVGYENPAKFTTAFKKEKGMPPKEFQKRCQNG